MKITTEINKENKEKFIKIVGRYIEKYRYMLIGFAALIAAASLALSIYWEFDEVSFGIIWDYVYLGVHIGFLLISLLLILLLLLNKIKKISNYAAAIINHIYAFIIVALATVLCISDLSHGESPMLYITAIVTVAGLFVMDPKFFLLLISLTALAIGLYSIHEPYPFFSDNYAIETILISVAFLFAVFLICLHHYNIIKREYKAVTALEKLTYYDELTGLLNERSYMLAVDSIDEAKKIGKSKRFGILMMDLNNLKATNDLHGHHFGCYLIIKCGELLPKYFPTSRLFHVGGDEFIALVEGEDLEHFDKRLANFDSQMLCQEVEYEGKTIILSVARGYAVCEEGQKYQEAYQEADAKMYSFKQEMKKKYDIHVR